MRKLTMIAITLLALVSCTDNQRARSFGGTETLKLEPNEKFINITWKQDNLWLIVQDPVTDNGLKKSAKGLLKVIKNTKGELVVKDGITWVELEQEDNLLVPVFKDGKFYNQTSLTEIRKKLNEH